MTGAVRSGIGRVVAAATVASVSSSLAIFIVGAEAVEIRQALHFDAATYGVVVALYFAGAGSGAVPASRLAETVGGVRVMKMACLAAACLLVALATVAVSVPVLAGVLVAAGVTSSAMQPAVNVFLARRVPEERQGAVFGVKQAAVPAAAVLGGLAVPAVALTIGWRWSFAVAGVVAVAAAVLVPPPRTTLAEHRSRPRARPPAGALGPLVVLAIGFGMAVFASSGLGAFTATAAVAAGASRGGAGLLVALGGTVAVLVRIVSGVIADRRGRAHLVVVAAMLGVGAMGYALLAAAAGLRSVPVLSAGVIVAFGAGWGWNGLFNFAVVRTHPEAPARATGVVQVGGRFAGAAGPLVFGVVADHVSYSAAWSVDAVMVGCGASVMLAGRRLLRRRLVRAASSAAG